MQFEVMSALQGLDDTTPSYLVDEIFAHGDQTVKLRSIVTLRELRPEGRSARILVEMIRLIAR